MKPFHTFRRAIDFSATSESLVLSIIITLIVAFSGTNHFIVSTLTVGVSGCPSGQWTHAGTMSADVHACRTPRILTFKSRRFAATDWRWRYDPSLRYRIRYVWLRALWRHRIATSSADHPHASFLWRQRRSSGEKLISDVPGNRKFPDITDVIAKSRRDFRFGRAALER